MVISKLESPKLGRMIDSDVQPKVWPARSDVVACGGGTVEPEKE
jgi:hypothetical protein